VRCAAQIYAEDCLTGLIGDLQTLIAKVHLVETSLAQNLIDDLQNSAARTVDVVEEQSFIVDDGPPVGLEMKEIARHGHLDRSVRAQEGAKHSVALSRKRLTKAARLRSL
jgi:lactam utilization protein B